MTLLYTHIHRPKHERHITLAIRQDVIPSWGRQSRLPCLIDTAVYPEHHIVESGDAAQVQTLLCRACEATWVPHHRGWRGRET